MPSPRHPAQEIAESLGLGGPHVVTDELELRAKRVFDTVVEIDDPAERARAVSVACTDDPSLRERVEALLAADEHPTDVAARIVTAAGADLAQGARGARVGPYEIGRLLAAGGMGQVYRARQIEPIQRDVALKLIRPGFGSEEVVHRFRAERQVLGMMSHRHIAQVYDAGTTLDGRPYFAMELVDGQHIDRHCDDELLSIEARLRLFLEVCEGVQHAHQKGIVHRDLKPSNVLVAREGDRAVPKVIDFGIAKALSAVVGDVPETVVGSTLGTPDYMSPEQAGLARAVDTRTDVYSLGVLLYELLAGSRPFPPEELRGLTSDAVRRLVREQVPERVSRRAAGLDVAGLAGRASSVAALERRLAGDLDWICARALEKEPDDRYDSVSDLARDVRRHLQAEPIEARPPSLLDRTRKFAARNRLAVIAAGLLLLGLVGTIGGLAIGLDQARRAEQAAKLEAERAERTARFLGQVVSEADARALGEAFLRELSEAVSDGGNEQGAVELDSLTAQVNRPDMARSVLSQVVLDRAVETAAETFAEDPLAHGRVLRTLARAYTQLSRTTAAERVARAAVNRLEKGAGALHRETLGAQSDLANILRRERRLDDALALHLEVLEHRRQQFGPLDPDTLGSLTNLGTLQSHLRDYEAADRFYDEALAGKEKVYGADAPEVVRMLYAVGSTAARRLDHERARELLTRAVELQTVQLGAEHPTTMESRSKLADVLAEMGDFREALVQRREIVAQRVEALGADHVKTLLERDLEGWLLGQMGRFDEVLDIYADLAGRYSASLGAHPYTGAAYLSQGWALAHLGRFESSERAIDRGIEILGRTLPADSPELRPARDMETLLAYRLGDFDRAVRNASMIVEQLDRQGPGDGLTGLHLRRRLAQALLDRGRLADLEQASAMLDQLGDAYEDALGSDHYLSLRVRGLALDARSRLLRLSGAPRAQLEELASRMEQVLGATETVFGADSYRMADPAVRFGRMLTSNGMSAGAIWTRRGRALDPAHPLLRSDRLASGG